MSCMKKPYLGAAALFQGLSILFLLALVENHSTMIDSVLIAHAIFSGCSQLVAAGAVVLAIFEGRDRSRLARGG